MRGFDDYVNMVLDDVTEYELDADGTKRKVQLEQVSVSNDTRDGSLNRTAWVVAIIEHGTHDARMQGDGG